MAFRLITALRIELEPPPGVHSQGIIANLDHDGSNLLKLQPRITPCGLCRFSG
ncbi:MAG: hypothetical protein H0T51_04375 [Pirellulales bacterium]|nr:hypothetical protein [Pirellulales bacterium]